MVRRRATTCSSATGFPATCSALGAKGCVVFSPTPAARLPRLPRATTTAGATRTGSSSTTVASSCRRGASASSGRCRCSTPSRTSSGSSTNLETFAVTVGAQVTTVSAGWRSTVADVFGRGRAARRRCRELAAQRRGTSIVVGGGHNGLTAAAYLAQAGKSVLVLEAPRAARWRVHARTSRSPTGGYKVSPCAYVVGLLDQRGDRRARPAQARLQRVRRRSRHLVPVRRRHAPTRSSSTTTAPSRTCARTASPTPTSRDSSRTRTFFDRMRRALREGRAATPGSATRPTATELEELLGHDPELIDVLFDVVDRRRHRPLLQGRAAAHRALRPGRDRRVGRPARPGHRVDQAHALLGRARRRARWRGATSRAAWAASPSRSPKPRAELGAVLAAGVPVARDPCPVRACELEGGEVIRARASCRTRTRR